MAVSSKSFFSGLSGFLAGVAGLITAVVAAAGLAVQQGWVGGGSGDGGKAGKEVVDGAVDDRSAASTTAVGDFVVEPASLTFQPVGARDAEVRVRNIGAVPLRLDSPTITGDDAERFDVDEGTCQEAVVPGRSCALRVSFDPRPGNFTALLVVEADQATRAREVPVKATGVL